MGQMADGMMPAFSQKKKVVPLVRRFCGFRSECAEEHRCYLYLTG